MISDLVLTIQAVYGAPEELHAVITPAAVTVSMTSLTSRPRTTISQTLQGADAAEWHNRLAKLGDLQTMKLDTLDYPDAIFGVILTYPGAEQIVVQVDADDPDMRDFWRVLNQLLTQGLNLANQSAVAEWRKLGPVLEYFVAVTFDDGGKAYYYRSDLTDLAIDDRVIVPVGQSNHLLTGTIVDITTDLPANLPIPPEDIKSVIRKKEVL